MTTAGPARARDLTDRQVSRLKWLRELPIDQGWRPKGAEKRGSRALETAGLIRLEWCGYRITQAGLDALDGAQSHLAYVQ